MRRFVVFGLLLLAFGFCAEAQKKQSITDTIQIKEVVSYGDLRKYQSGAKIETIPAEQINLAAEGGIENVLMRFAPIYIKSNAGGLSTIRFRGTSPDHTSINFGGINVNSLTLGHSNLSNIPSFLFDNISLQYGSSSAVNGSGAIGGALYLGLENRWTNGIKLSVKNSIGSFGEYQFGTKVFIGNGKWEAVTRFYYFEKENNFPFNNPYTGDVENPGAVRDIQQGASIKNRGILQQLNYRFNDMQYFKSSVWVEKSWHQIQPNMQSNYHYKSAPEINNDNIRIWTEYTDNSSVVRFKAGAGYVHDLQIYNKVEDQIIGTDRLIGEFQATTDFDSGLGLKAGAKYKYIKPNVYSYSDSVIDFEQHLDFFFSAFYRVNRNLKFTLNLRQMFVTNFSAPFTPSLGAEYMLATGDKSKLEFTAAIAKSYRVPTFNDRYWGTQGNPNLKPEEGKNFELGTKYIFGNKKVKTTFGVNAFYMDINNWIEWRNFGEWRAENIQEVVSKGLEFQAGTSFPIGEISGNFNINYTFNIVQPVATIEENGLLNRQMNYVPENVANTTFSLNYKRWHFFTDGQFTGSRFTNDFGDEMPAYFVANCGVGYKVELSKHNLDFVFSTNNVFNADYQNQKYYAMPGRYFRFSLKYDFITIK